MHMQEGTMDVANENLLKVMRWGRRVVAQDVAILRSDFPMAGMTSASLRGTSAGNPNLGPVWRFFDYQPSFAQCCRAQFSGHKLFNLPMFKTPAFNAFAVSLEAGASPFARRPCGRMAGACSIRTRRTVKPFHQCLCLPV